MTSHRNASDPHDYSDEGDLAEQRSPVGEEEGIDVPSGRGIEDADEADLLEQTIPVPDDDDEYRS